MSETFCRLYEAPLFAASVLERIVSPLERELLLAMKDTSEFSARDAAVALGIEESEAVALLDEAYRRGVVNRVAFDSDLFTKGTLYDRLALFCQFEHESWLSVEESIRKELDAWYLKEYARRCLDGVVAKLNNRAAENLGMEAERADFLGNDVVLPPDEALAFIDSVEHDIYLLPCNCRTIAGNCDKPVETCIQFKMPDSVNWPIDRGWGRKIRKEEAKEVLRQCHEAGLVHSVGRDAICNCDSCCCYPFRAAPMLRSKDIWPRTKYRVVWDDEKCVRCGICEKRCPFGVFEVKKGESTRVMAVDTALCQGCGLCVTKCPKDALTLKPV